MVFFSRRNSGCSIIWIMAYSKMFLCWIYPWRTACWTCNWQLNFFFFFLQNPMDFVLPPSGIDHKICVDFFKWPDISPVSDCFFCLETHKGLSSHLCFNNFSMIYLIVDYCIIFVWDNMYPLHLKIQISWETVRKLKTHRG